MVSRDGDGGYTRVVLRTDLGDDHGELPVRVVDAGLEEVWRGLSGAAELELEPGLYAARATLPDGTELRQPFAVEGNTMEVTLSPPVSPGLPKRGGTRGGPARGPDSGVRVLRKGTGGEEPRSGRGGTYGPSSPRVRGGGPPGAAEPPSPGEVFLGVEETPAARPDVQLFLSLWRQCDGDWCPEPWPSGPELTLPGSGHDGLRFLEVAAAGGTATAAVPRDPLCLVVDSHRPELELRVESRNRSAEALLAYLRRGDVDNARQLFDQRPELALSFGSERQARARDLLASKFEDPIAAAAGAFALLRGEHPEAVPSWFENLAHSFPSLPDGAIARAWQLLAGTGEGVGERRPEQDQAEARALLLTAARRGLPALTEALRRLLDGLMLFQFDAGGQADPEVRAELERLRPYTNGAVWSAARTTFRGSPGELGRVRGGEAGSRPLRVPPGVVRVELD